MIYLLYKTTNTINGKFYIGVHKQHNLEFDGYLGSGTSIKIAIKKYGKENFIRENIQIFTNSEEAFAEEKNHLKNLYKTSQCYNRHPGGQGIRDYNDLNMPIRPPMSTKNRLLISERMKRDNPNYKPGVKEKISNSKKGVPNNSTACCHPITLNGISYKSKNEACRKLNISYGALQYRLNRNENDIRKLSEGNPKKFMINGYIYNSFIEAKNVYFPDVSIPTARKRLRQLGMVAV